MRTTILHITDLHFTSSREETPSVVKDGEISDEFRKEVIGLNIWDRFIADIRHLRADTPIDMIACTGDLGCEGKEESLALGIKYLAKLAKDLDVPPQHVVVSPGNHDLNRKVQIGEELNEFCNQCKTEGFTFAERVNPAVISVNNIPIIALNTCLGGTEHALHGLPKEFWEAELELLRKKEADGDIGRLITQLGSDLEYQVQAMDIPAVGIDQIGSCYDALLGSDGNCAVVLMHHNPLPTSNIDIRPYANLIDSGPLLLRLMGNGRHVVILHGHTHSESGLSVHMHQEDKGGFIASIGSRGFSVRSNAVASLAKITTTARNDFIKLDVYFIKGNTTIFQNYFQYSLSARSIESFQPEDWDLDKLPKNRQLTFDEVSKLVQKAPDDSLEEDLVQLEPTSVKISGEELSRNEWRITRIR